MGSDQSIPLKNPPEVVADHSFDANGFLTSPEMSSNHITVSTVALDGAQSSAVGEDTAEFRTRPSVSPAPKVENGQVSSPKKAAEKDKISGFLGSTPQLLSNKLTSIVDNLQTLTKRVESASSNAAKVPETGAGAGKSPLLTSTVVVAPLKQFVVAIESNKPLQTQSPGNTESSGAAECVKSPPMVSPVNVDQKSPDLSNKTGKTTESVIAGGSEKTRVSSGGAKSKSSMAADSAKKVGGAGAGNSARLRTQNNQEVVAKFSDKRKSAENLTSKHLFVSTFKYKPNFTPRPQKASVNNSRNSLPATSVTNGSDLKGPRKSDQAKQLKSSTTAASAVAEKSNKGAPKTAFNQTVSPANAIKNSDATAAAVSLDSATSGKANVVFPIDLARNIQVTTNKNQPASVEANSVASQKYDSIEMRGTIDESDTSRTTEKIELVEETSELNKNGFHEDSEESSNNPMQVNDRLEEFAKDISTSDDGNTRNLLPSVEEDCVHSTVEAWENTENGASEAASETEWTASMQRLTESVGLTDSVETRNHGESRYGQCDADAGAIDVDKISELLASAKNLIGRVELNGREREPTQLDSRSSSLADSAYDDSSFRSSVRTSFGEVPITVTDTSADGNSIDTAKISALLASAQSLVSRVSQPSTQQLPSELATSPDSGDSIGAADKTLHVSVESDAEEKPPAALKIQQNDEIDADRISALLADASSLLNRVAPTTPSLSPRLIEPERETVSNDVREEKKSPASYQASDDETYDAESNDETDVNDVPNEQQLQSLISSARSYASSQLSVPRNTYRSSVSEVDNSASASSRLKLIESITSRSTLGRRLAGSTTTSYRAADAGAGVGAGAGSIGVSAPRSRSIQSIFDDDRSDYSTVRQNNHYTSRSYYAPLHRDSRHYVDISERVSTLPGFRDQHRLLCRNGFRRHLEDEEDFDLEQPDVNKVAESAADSSFYQSVFAARSILSTLGRSDDVFATATDDAYTSASTRTSISSSSVPRRSYYRSYTTASTALSEADQSVWEPDAVDSSAATVADDLDASTQNASSTESEAVSVSATENPPPTVSSNKVNDSFLQTLNEADAILSLLAKTG